MTCPACGRTPRRMGIRPTAHEAPCGQPCLGGGIDAKVAGKDLHGWRETCRKCLRLTLTEEIKPRRRWHNWSVLGRGQKAPHKAVARP